MKLTKEVVEQIIKENNQAIVQFDEGNLIPKEFKMSPSQRVVAIKNKLKDPAIQRLLDTIQYHFEQNENEKRPKRMSQDHVGTISPLKNKKRSQSILEVLNEYKRDRHQKFSPGVHQAPPISFLKKSENAS